MGRSKIGVNQASRADTADQPQKSNKAKVVQERSRLTRLKVVKSALRLWTSRGFDEGFDATTVDDIAEAAGVSRATVYYYFPRKEDILREMAWATANEIYECALRSIMSGRPVDEVLSEIVGLLGDKVMRSSAAAVARMLQVRRTDANEIERDSRSGGLSRSFTIVILHAQEAGELPRHFSAREIAEIMASVCMGYIARWSIAGDSDLSEAMRQSTALILAGVRNYPAVDA